MNETTWQDGIRRYAHGVTYTTHDDVMISPAEVRELYKTVQRLQAENERLRNLVAASAPLAWVLNEDVDGAQAWEKRALEVLDEDQ